MSGVDVLAIGVTEREGGSILKLAFDREEASSWAASVSWDYRNQNMPGPSYWYVELVDRAAVAELIEVATEAFNAPDVMWTIEIEDPALAERLAASLAAVTPADGEGE